MYTIIFDWKRTLYDPDSKRLNDGTLKLLKFLKQKNIKIILIGKGGSEMNQEVKRLKIEKYFSTIIFQESHKDKKLFKPFISLKNPKSTIVVGDRIQSELKIGKQLKAVTIWVKQGKFSSELPSSKNQEPDITVSSIIELLEFFKRKFNRQNPA